MNKTLPQALRRYVLNFVLLIRVEQNSKHSISLEVLYQCQTTLQDPYQRHIKEDCFTFFIKLSLHLIMYNFHLTDGDKARQMYFTIC
jgi:hypothetical protein